jgi:hypothetical protein
LKINVIIMTYAEKEMIYGAIKSKAKSL